MTQSQSIRFFCFSLTSLALRYVATVGVHTMACGMSTVNELWMVLMDSDDDSDVEDLILLPELEKRSRLHAARAERRARHRKWIDFESLTSEQCKSWFRFEKEYIPGNSLCALLVLHPCNLRCGWLL